MYDSAECGSDPSGLSDLDRNRCISGYLLWVDMGRIYASEWLGQSWRTKGSDFESVVYMFWGLVFLVNLTPNYHLETYRHHLSQSKLLATLPNILTGLTNTFRPGATC